MVEKKPKKEKIKIATREPQKPKPGIFDELGKGRQQNVKHPFSEIVNFPSDVNETTHTTHAIISYDNPSDPIQPIQVETIKKPVSPVSDFQKVPNSITRDGIPNKLFKGTSKNTYDALYLKTRGAIKPVRTIKATKRELMKWIGISHVTIFKHLKHLESVGLIAIEQQLGSHAGSIYEVFIPEEVQPIPSHPILTNTTHPIPSYENSSNAIQSNKLERESSNKAVWDRMGNHIENKELNLSSNTSLKTNTKSDDEAFATLNELFARACEKLTGKSPNKSQQENWKELAELLIMELEVASARTKSVSNVPSFLTEHLRRRLMPTKREAPKSKSNKTSPIGKQQLSEPIEQYQAEPLTEQGRESTLKAFAGYMEKGQKEFLLGLQDSYTREDWAWLIKELKIS
jgi:predicted transcriptional regulator